ncbi:DNA-binding transcriptional LysR family regulator [Kibdelosporangium banguiense]|uniref:DNA-binding transcriptional LysR family regulator n=1 Tax=Kibdelosporangium banguiense TaxID=1365924 RepID=A0ABS4TJ89_9PSEU|nr:LysR family transcriptional regulator [Kibdelosporangium banguiense]MBP2324478.1 DNA-binding transcriptional LysR family regulator [Kibdelosporangium banguiense]
MDLDLAQVRAFVVTADQRHFSRAAQALFVTQQALSKRIRRLEEVLATQLFVRSNRSVELTEDGRKFLPHARELIRVADAAVAALGDQPLRLDLLDYRLAPMSILRKLAEQDPELRVDRSALGGLDKAIGPLLKGELDVAFGWVHGIGGPVPDELDHRVIRLEPLLALLPPEHVLAGQDAIHIDDLKDEGLWLPGRESPTEWHRFTRLMGERLGLRMDHSGISYDLRHTLEQARYGKPRVTLVGADMELPRDLNLRVLPFAPLPLFPWSIVWRKGKLRTALRQLLASADRTSRAEGWCDRDPVTSWVP